MEMSYNMAHIIYNLYSPILDHITWFIYGRYISIRDATIPLSDSDFKRVRALFFGVPYFGCPGQIAALSDECRGFGSDIFFSLTKKVSPDRVQIEIVPHHLKT